MKKELICIICPRGCKMCADIPDCSLADMGKPGCEIVVSGNACKRGEVYAITECTNPQRSITSTVRVANRPGVMVSVKTKDPVAKDKIFDVMKVIRSLEAKAPIEIGDELCDNVAGTKIIATKDVE